MHKRESSLMFSQFGADGGPVVIYFHGAPGAPDECKLFEQLVNEYGLTLLCFDRFSADPSKSGESYYRFLANEILEKTAGRQVDVIGFSIGAFVALQTCRYLGNKVKTLHLVSAAAPLDGGDFIQNMAGKQVFRLAKNFPGLFLLLSYWQKVLAILVPDTLFRLLFASAAGADKSLAVDYEFQSKITKILKSCFSGRVKGYVRDVLAYVQPWKNTLADISVSTSIWHGAEDNWSPSSMAHFLRSAIPGDPSIKIFEGLSHYSCLCQAMPEICSLLSNEKGGD